MNKLVGRQYAQTDPCFYHFSVKSVKQGGTGYVSPIAMPLSTPGKTRIKMFLASFPKYNNIYSTMVDVQ